MDENDLIANSRHSYTALAEQEFDDSFELLAERCESPIERVLLAELIVMFRECGDDRGLFGGRLVGPDPLMWSAAAHEKALHDFNTAPWSERTLFIQAEMGRYRTDFAIVLRDSFSKHQNKIIAIECDGHDFHERTKEQARRDRSRDRWMAIHGISCVHFTGSEIWANASSCVEEVFKITENFYARRGK